MDGMRALAPRFGSVAAEVTREALVAEVLVGQAPRKEVQEDREAPRSEARKDEMNCSPKIPEEVLVWATGAVEAVEAAEVERVGQPKKPKGSPEVLLQPVAEDLLGQAPGLALEGRPALRATNHLAWCADEAGVPARRSSRFLKEANSRQPCLLIVAHRKTGRECSSLAFMRSTIP